MSSTHPGALCMHYRKRKIPLCRSFMELAGLEPATSWVRSRLSVICLRRMSLGLWTGTKRVRQLGHERARASIPKVLK